MDYHRIASPKIPLRPRGPTTIWGGGGAKLRDTVNGYHKGHLSLGPNTASFSVTGFEVKSRFPVIHHFRLSAIRVSPRFV